MKPTIVIQTDFGVGGGGAMTGVIKNIDQEVDVYNANHSIEKFNVRAAARSLSHLVPYWPEGTIFVSVIDPGVGTARRASVAKLKNGSYVVTPDNGALTTLLENPGVEAIRIIDETKNRLKGTEKVSIFHGRDLFAYCAGKLASGIIDFEGVGEEYPVSEIITYDALGFTVEEGKVSGYVTDMMRTFGNMETSIPIEAGQQAGLEIGKDVHLCVKEKDNVVVSIDVPFQPSFGWVEQGQEVVYNSSDGVLGVGINQGNFIEKYNIGFGKDWTVSIERLD